MVARRRRFSVLQVKLLRGFRENAMQFLAMLLLCALGTFAFSGLDGTWRMQERTIETYLSRQNLADLWVSGSALERGDLLTIANLPGVERILPRTSLTVDVVAPARKVTARVHAYHQSWAINTPYLSAGQMLGERDRRGVLVEEQFARAQGWTVGSSITLKIGQQERSYAVSGLVFSPEYLITSDDVAPSPETYGFVLMTTDMLPGFPLNECLVRLQEGTVPDGVLRELQARLPEAVAITQKTHASTMGARNYIAMFHALSFLFPSLAYFVAVLIVITTLSRMIDNERMQIGTLKSLGYRKGPIRAHYLAYAFYPAALGSLLGLYAGHTTLPWVIWKMIETNVRVPAVGNAPVSALSWAMTAAEVVVAMLICVHQIHSRLKESTASLLRPKPPRSGARVLLEYWTGLWRRLSFNKKMVVRNLLRNKGRTAMTLIGLLCCNMLIICSFGLKESIPYFSNHYYQKTLNYDLRFDLDTSKSGTLESYRGRIRADRIDGVMERSVDLRTEKEERTVRLIVLDDAQESFHLDELGESTALPAEGLLIGKKLAALMGLVPGDVAELWFPGKDRPTLVPIVDYAHINVGLDLFMRQSAWEALREGDFQPSALVVTGMGAQERLRVEELEEVSGIKAPPDQYKQTLRILDSASTAFSILGGVALGLAFVICYNMGLMNFTERTREYATLKVLGYHQKEIRSLMMRENNWTTLAGTALGIAPGIAMVSVILKMCEFETMVFRSHVTLRSILPSCAITIAFSLFIEILLTRKVRSIVMVEALKSVE